MQRLCSRSAIAEAALVTWPHSHQMRNKPPCLSGRHQVLPAPSLDLASVLTHWVMSQALSDCRMKRADILQSAEAAREGVQKRVREQEVSVEHRLDELETGLQVRLPSLSTGVPSFLPMCSLQSALACI